MVESSATVNLLTAVAKAVILVGSVGYAFHLIHRHILTPAWRAMKALQQLADAMPVLLEIAEEFQPNSGTSLRDAVNRIEQSQQRVATRLDALEAS